MKTISHFALVLLSITILAESAYSFCGFYVAKADTKLFNKASQVVIVRDEDKTVMTMANDFKGACRICREPFASDNRYKKKNHSLSDLLQLYLRKPV